ncbi:MULTISPECIES: peptidoglycan-binding protein [Lysobacter]|uniref:Peptidoglycan-binding domain-containing protein n=1 Tax=Lysobacter firmicutimachus TaxID=1792846 RepID=A0ABU8D7C4_9GAMM|nr:peptidoglycan-binding protein [Lysobacter antibioticus]
MDRFQNSNEGIATVNYRVIQKGVSVNIPVGSFDSLVTHHPFDNQDAVVSNGRVIRAQPGRRHALIGGEVQEIAISGERGALNLTEDQVLLKKDFMLEDSRIPSGGRGVRDVDVPSPVAGYVGRCNAAEGLVDIYDRKGGEVIARIRHMQPIHVQEDTEVAYGQSLGMQNNQATAKVHVHMEVDTRYYKHYENYVDDLVSGRLSIDPARRNQGIGARPVIDDGVIRIGETSGVVEQLQRVLNEQGYLDANGQRLPEDGVYRLSMQAAVIRYQDANGLPRTGDIDPATLQQALPRVFPSELNRPLEERGLPSYLGPLGAVGPAAAPRNDPFLVQAEAAVRRMEQGLGRGYDENSARLAASVAGMAREAGLSKIDHIVLSQGAGTVRPGEFVFAVEGALNDPAHRRAHMRTDEALAQPVERSLEKLQAANEVQARQATLEADQQGQHMAHQPRTV